jgi:hypothetical protein
MKPVRDWEGVDAHRFHTDIETLNRPAVIRGLVKHWPAVAHARESPQALAEYLIGCCNDRPVSALVGDPEIKGRFFYLDDLQGFNFAQQRLPLGKVVSFLLEELRNEHAAALYAGAVPVLEHIPGLQPEHTLDLIDPSIRRQTSLWIGNRTRVAAHWDQQQNVACVVSGRRRYILFPTHQIKNLYIGPLDRTPAGVPISLVDFHRPDYQRFPRFREALEFAEVAELEPGDALYLPSLWVHHAESLDAFGLMINFWWQSWPQQISPYLTLLHSLLSIRDLPPPVREGWRALFDLYVFQTDGDPMAHIPEQARGLFASLTPGSMQTIISQLRQSLEGAARVTAPKPPGPT